MRRIWRKLLGLTRSAPQAEEKRIVHPDWGELVRHHSHVGYWWEGRSYFKPVHRIVKVEVAGTKDGPDEQSFSRWERLTADYEQVLTPRWDGILSRANEINSFESQRMLGWVKPITGLRLHEVSIKQSELTLSYKPLDDEAPNVFAFSATWVEGKIANTGFDY